jgi:hypothetical protein
MSGSGARFCESRIDVLVVVVAAYSLVASRALALGREFRAP